MFGCSQTYKVSINQCTICNARKPFKVCQTYSADRISYSYPRMASLILSGVQLKGIGLAYIFFPIIWPSPWKHKLIMPTEKYDYYISFSNRLLLRPGSYETDNHHAVNIKINEINHNGASFHRQLNGRLDWP